MTDNEFYSNYIERRPHHRSEILIERWHGRLLDLVLSKIQTQPLNVLEIGPGHGYFAKKCVDHGLQYQFCDTSPAVFNKMQDLGFEGHLGMISQIGVPRQSFDIVWVSHVLEHSPTWLDAREMVLSASQLLVDGGVLVIVSPDYLSWRRNFWNIDWSHGYPTTKRNVIQICSDVGFAEVDGYYHRNASLSLATRFFFALLTIAPHNLIDRVLTPNRAKKADGFVYSWKCVFGWRQILIISRKARK